MMRAIDVADDFMAERPMNVSPARCNLFAELAVS